MTREVDGRDSDYRTFVDLSWRVQAAADRCDTRKIRSSILRDNVTNYTGRQRHTGESGFLAYQRSPAAGSTRREARVTEKST